MKKILTIVLAAMAMASQAVTFTWDSNATKISFDGATTIAAAGGITATLLWLGTDSLASVVDYSVANALVADTTKTKSTGMATNKGKYSQDYTKAIGAKIDNSSESTLAAGDYFTTRPSWKSGHGTPCPYINL